MNKPILKEKFKKSAMSFLYRLIVCVCIFGVLFIFKHFSPPLWGKVRNVFLESIDISKVTAHLGAFVKEILPF